MVPRFSRFATQRGRVLTALIAAFSTSQPASREAEAREEKRARRCEKSGTRALSRPLQRAVDGTPINYSSHIKNHSDLFFTWPFSLLRPVDNQDGSRIFLNFIYFKWILFRYELFESEFEPRQDVEYLSSFEISLDFLFLKTFFLPLLEGYFIISLVEIKLEMKLDKSCAGYEKLRDYVSSLGWRMYFFFVPGKPIFHEEFSNQEHSSSCWIRMVVETVRSSIRYIKGYKCHSDYDRSRTSALVNILHFLTEWIFITRYTQDLTFYIIFIEKNLEYCFTIIYYHEELIRFQEILKQIRIINSSSSYVIHGVVNY